jgi:hypothetical protein
MQKQPLTSKSMSVIDEKVKKQKEAQFDSYYDTIMTLDEQLERITLVSNMLKKKYEEYAETGDFVNFLHAVEEVFAYAKKENWSVEKTQKEMIESEIYIISRTTGIDEEIFRKIRREFKQADNDIKKIQDIANNLSKKYDNNDDCPVCVDFIRYVKDSLLIFSRAISGDTAFDELDEAKEGIIKMRMEEMARDGAPPMEVLQQIYDDFVTELRK